MECNLVWNHNRTSEFNLKSQVWFLTKIARREVQLPLYYIHLKITQQYYYLITKIQLFSQYLVSTNISLIQLGTKVAIQWFSLSYIFLQFDWLP